MYFLKVDLSENTDLETSQDNGFSPICVSIFVFISEQWKTELHSGEFREILQEKLSILQNFHAQNQSLSKNVFSLWYVFGCVFYVSKLFFTNSVDICEWRNIKVL